MTAALYLVVYAALAVFLVACVVRALRYARMPLHLRWELYPVPHEEPERARHGGSYFESVDWWTRPAHANRLGELKVMVPEILFLKGLWEFNRKLWFRSYPFHLGLYLLIATAALVALAAVAPPLVPALHYLYTATGLAGAALAVLGAAALLIHRLRDETLKTYTTPGDIFNLAFFIIAAGTLAAGYLVRDAGAPSVRDITRALLTFDTSLGVPGLLAAGIILSALLAAYIPLTHMSHFIAKYFTYHSVRWDDRPNRKGAELEKKIAEYLTYRPTWSAPHIGADGARTWADIAATNPAERRTK